MNLTLKDFEGDFGRLLALKREGNHINWQINLKKLFVDNVEPIVKECLGYLNKYGRGKKMSAKDRESIQKCLLALLGTLYEVWWVNRYSFKSMSLGSALKVNGVPSGFINENVQYMDSCQVELEQYTKSIKAEKQEMERREMLNAINRQTDAIRALSKTNAKPQAITICERYDLRPECN